MTDRPIFAPGLFAGRRALVTGGGTGIGLAIARELGGLGAHVVLAARTAATLEKAAAELRAEGIAADWLPVNIRKEAEVEDLFDRLEREHGPADILVNNAGGQFFGRALDISPNGFRAVVDLNLQGTWHMCRAFGTRAIAAGRGGRIVNIVLSLENGMPGYAHSAAARAGVMNLAKTLAVEWGRKGITINNVAPGTIETAALAQYDMAALKAEAARLPVDRFGTPREVALAVAYLASPAADYTTGTTLYVDGGETLIGVLVPRETPA